MAETATGDLQRSKTTRGRELLSPSKEIRRRDRAVAESRCSRPRLARRFCHILTEMAPEDITQPEPASDGHSDPVESSATGEMDTPEDGQEMLGSGVPPAEFVH